MKLEEAWRPTGPGVSSLCSMESLSGGEGGKKPLELPVLLSHMWKHEPQFANLRDATFKWEDSSLWPSCLESFKQHHQ